MVKQDGQRPIHQEKDQAIKNIGLQLSRDGVDQDKITELMEMFEKGWDWGVRAYGERMLYVMGKET